MAAPAPPFSSRAPAPNGGDDAAPVRVLMIEDDPIVADSTHMLLEDLGCEVAAAVTAEEALAASLRLSGTPELILADFRLPGNDGLYAIEQVRSHHGQPIRACVVSADETPGMRARIAAAGCGFMRKPMRPAHLEALLAAARGRGAAAA